MPRWSNLVLLLVACGDPNSDPVPGEVVCTSTTRTSQGGIDSTTRSGYDVDHQLVYTVREVDEDGARLGSVRTDLVYTVEGWLRSSTVTVDGDLAGYADSRTTFDHDADGLVVREEQSAGGLPFDVTVRTYDADGQLVRAETTCLAQGCRESATDVTWVDGRPVLSETRNAAGSLSAAMEWAYLAPAPARDADVIQTLGSTTSTTTEWYDGDTLVETLQMVDGEPHRNRWTYRSDGQLESHWAYRDGASSYVRHSYDGLSRRVGTTYGTDDDEDGAFDGPTSSQVWAWSCP